MNIDKHNLNIILGKKVFFSVLNCHSFQSCYSNPGAVLVAEPQRHTHEELSAAVQCSTALSAGC